MRNYEQSGVRIKQEVELTKQHKPVQQQANNTVMNELFHLNADVKHMINMFINDSITLHFSVM